MAPEPGSASRSQPFWDPGMFKGITTVGEFARAIEVPEKAINLVVPTTDRCQFKRAGSKNCLFNAVERNHKMCVCHSKTWYPLENTRGEDMHGPEFQNYDGIRGCDCSQAACISAGYFPYQSAICIPKEGWDTVMDTPNLLSSDKIEKLENGDTEGLYLAAWHFFPQHREKDANGKWIIKYEAGGKYHDLERKKSYSYPPPRAIPQVFIETEYFSDRFVRPQDRWAEEFKVSKMPSWMLNMQAIDEQEAFLWNESSPSNHDEKQSSEDTAWREAERWKARVHWLWKEQLAKEKQSQEAMDKLSRGKDEEIEKLQHNNKKQAETIEQLQKDYKELEERLEKSIALLKEVREKKKEPLRYQDLAPGGLLADHVKDYTLFDTYEQNEAFLEILNYADGSPGSFPVGDGLCENIRPYSHVSRAERNGAKSPPCFDMDSREYKQYIVNSKANSLKDRMWKDDYFTWCMYVRCGMTEEAAAGLSGISTPRMSNIFHEWAQILDSSLQEWFPTPTRSQLLRNYPARFIEAHDHAKSALLLDAFEVFCMESSNYDVASSTFSKYKEHTTIKFLGGCCPIGCSWAGTVPDGFPGRCSDVVATLESGILKQVPFGYFSICDKGFIVDNIAADEGNYIIRPQKRLKKQVQQSAADTAQTQKVGNTRIIVENVNGELKLHIRWLNSLIPCHQFPIVSKIVRIGYLLQNFKCPIVQHNNPNDSSPDGGRSCRGEIRFYGEESGATDAGLIDVRDNVKLWGLDCEVKRHAELSAMEENKNKTPTEISEMVLAEKWDVKMREQLYALNSSNN